MIAQVVDLFAADIRVRCWPWERVRFAFPDERFRTEDSLDGVTIRGTVEGPFSTRHAEVKVSGKVLVAYKRTGQRGFVIDAFRHAMEELAEKLATRPAYTPPPKGWRKFGRVAR